MSVVSRFARSCVRSAALAPSLLLALSVVSAGALSLPAQALPPTKSQKAQVSSAYGRLPFAFEQNAGQSDPQVKFLARGPGYTLFLTPTQAVMTVSQPQAAPKPGPKNNVAPAAPKASVLRMTLKGANPAPAIVGQGKLPGEAASFKGRDQSKWRSRIATYGQVSYSQVYKGVDLRYYGNQKQLEYDFIVQPGADPKAIALGFEGAQSVTLNKQGDLLLRTANGDVCWHRPVAYQTVNGKRVPVSGRFVVQNHTARFAVGRYDKKLPLTIDPSLGYSTFLGGLDDDSGYAIAVDGSGNAYVTGYTASTDFPRTLNDASINNDVFITKVNPSGTALMYSIVLGGGSNDYGYGIAVDSHGYVDVCGSAGDGSFPAGSGTYKGAYDAFLAQVKSDGSGFYFIKYIHLPSADDTKNDYAQSVAVDSADNIYVCGTSEYDTTYFYNVASILKFSSEGVLQSYNEALGYDGGGTYGYGIAVDASDNVYVTGKTGCADLYSHNNLYRGGGDGFVAKLTSSLSYIYATYLGGASYDYCQGIAADASGNAYVTGATASSDFPVTKGPAYAGSYDPFVTKINPAGTVLLYSTLLKNTTGYDFGYGIGVDSLGQAYVCGSTYSTNASRENVFVAQMTATGGLKDSRNLIGTNTYGQYGYGLAVGKNSVAYVTGFTYSSDFRVTPGAYDTSFNGNSDAFVDAIAFNSPVLSSISPSSVYAGSSTFTLTANGTGFLSGAKVYLNSTGLTTTFVSSTKLTASVSSSLVTSVGTASISVVNPGANGSTDPKTLTITPKLTTLSLSPTSVTGGATSTGTVTLSDNAPAAGVTITLSSSSTSAATVPASVTVTSGHSTATFTVTSKPVSSNKTVMITASGAGATKTATLTVNAPKLSSLSLSSAVAAGGTNVTATATLTGKAPSGGTVVTPSSSGSAATVPSSVTVAAGSNTATFTVATHSVSSNTNVTIGAVAGGVTKTQTLTITAGSGPVTIQSLSLSPTSVKGGAATSTGMVTLTGPAPAGGLSVTQTSSNTAAATLSGTLNIPAGASSAKFKITTYAVSSTKSVTIMSSAAGTSKSQTLTVTP